MKKTAENNEGMKIALRYYWGCAKRYPAYLWGVGLTMPITTLFSRYLPPLIIAHVLDKLIERDYNANNLVGSFGGEMALFIAVLVVGIALWRLVDFFMWRLEQNIQQDIAEHVFRHLQSLSLNFHANNFGGSLVSQTNKLLGGYVRIQDSTIYQAYPMVLGILWAIIILAPKSPQYAFGLAIFSVLYLAISWQLAKKIYVHLARFATAESKQTGMLADVITNIGVVKSFARSKHEVERFHRATSTTRRYLQRFAKVHQWQMNIQGLMSRIISSFAFVVAIVAVTKYDANIPIVFLMFNYTLTIVDQLFDFGNTTLRSYNRALSDAREMAMKLTLEPEVKDPVRPEKPRFKNGGIEFQNVTFRHDGADDAIFEDFNIDIKPGEKIGLVGHSGSGKTTFTRLLLRYSDIQSGAITIDAQNISHVTQDSLHECIAYVPQEPLLFHRSIRENIGYGDLTADETDIVRAARMAHAHEFIETLPQGYETLVGERGVKLSGGQRQRIAIARAMLKNAPILLLDEATSALDSESEVLIQDALWKLMEGRTAIVIAHRLSTIQKMDRIVVLDNGKIVEEGSHKSLLRRKGTYAKLWAHQSGGFIDE